MPCIYLLNENKIDSKTSMPGLEAGTSEDCLITNNLEKLNIDDIQFLHQPSIFVHQPDSCFRTASVPRKMDKYNKISLMF